MKRIVLIFILIFPILILSGCNTVSNTNENVEVQRTGVSSNEEAQNNNSSEENSNTSSENNSAENNTDETNNTLTENQVTEEKQETAKEPTETVLSEFSTTLKSKSSNRLNNIQLTCSKLNGTTVKSNEEFSFCKTIGKVTEEKGYKKADVIINKEVTQALGGGNCQVSSTLYNAVLNVPNLKVTERHPHGKKVNYVPEGKDAAVSYGSKDFKFINNTSNTIKIYASTDNKKVSIKIVALK